MMDVDGIDFDNELRRIENEINRHISTLQSHRYECENTEVKIRDVRQLQRKAQFVLNNVQSEQETFYERFKNLSLNYEACVERSGGHEDPNETIRARISELTTRKNELLDELARLRRNLNDNGRKLANVRAMIVEQEGKNAKQLQELKEISESGVFNSPEIKERLDAILERRGANDIDDAIDNTL
ncbi:PREDICTED: uncharacterized protein LOC105568631 isoform X2 [Vollenhovia emeryi]|nr:PREDICTED: uncharacterized protein LOC105568631 isoform X2 [Vollenhovia emeryi]XP_011879843.1 PREDICTED: uncharacterized protein LOC105568631 isoform X2 [Vollenhovia emeryi]